MANRLMVESGADRWEVIARLTAGLAGLGRPVTQADITTVVDGMTEDEVRRFLIALLADVVAGLVPPAVGLTG